MLESLEGMPKSFAELMLAIYEALPMFKEHAKRLREYLENMGKLGPGFNSFTLAFRTWEDLFGDESALTNFEKWLEMIEKFLGLDFSFTDDPKIQKQVEDFWHNYYAEGKDIWKSYAQAFGLDINEVRKLTKEQILDIISGMTSFATQLENFWDLYYEKGLDIWTAFAQAFGLDLEAVKKLSAEQILGLVSDMAGFRDDISSQREKESEDIRDLKETVAFSSVKQITERQGNIMIAVLNTISEYLKQFLEGLGGFVGQQIYGVAPVVNQMIVHSMRVDSAEFYNANFRGGAATTRVTPRSVQKTLRSKGIEVAF